MIPIIISDNEVVCKHVLLSEITNFSNILISSNIIFFSPYLPITFLIVFVPNSTKPPTSLTASSLTLVAMSLNLSVTLSLTISLEIKFGSSFVSTDKVLTTRARTPGRGSENMKSRAFRSFSKSVERDLSVRIALYDD